MRASGRGGVPVRGFLDRRAAGKRQDPLPARSLLQRPGGVAHLGKRPDIAGQGTTIRRARRLGAGAGRNKRRRASRRRSVMRIAFVADPLESLDPSVDTTVGIMHAAQDRGAEVWVTQARLLEAVHGRARALACRVRLAPSRPLAGHRWAVAQPWFTAAEPQHVWLDE